MAIVRVVAVQLFGTCPEEHNLSVDPLIPSPSFAIADLLTGVFQGPVAVSG